MSHTTGNLEALFERIRDSYVSNFIFHQAKLSRIPDDVVSEQFIRDSGNALIRCDVLNLPRRVDFKIKSDTKFRVNCRSAQKFFFEEFEVVYKGLHISLAPFSWDQLHIAFQTGGQVNMQPMRTWFLEYFQDRRLNECETLSGAVHSLKGPVITGKVISFTLDLGTAPTTALISLIGVIMDLGARSLSLGSVPSEADRVLAQE